jgi:cytochrome c oxidase assembly factor CtaG
MFFAAGALFWAAVLEPLPGPAWFGDGWKALYVLVVRVIGMALANVFIWSGHVFYGAYRVREARFGIAPLTDQRIAGLVMFTEGGIVTLVAFAVMFLRWQRAAELRQSLLDRGADPRAAQRAARYRRRSVAAPPR